MATLAEFMASWTQLGVYSKITQPMDRLQRFFGCQIGGPNEMKSRGRLFAYRYFDHTRDVADFRAPGTGPSTVSNQSMGQVTGTFARVHEKKILDYETLGNLRPMELNAPLDPGGQQYLTRQQKHLHQRFSNAREVALAGCLRGNLGFTVSGDRYIPVLSGGDITIDFNIPSTHKGALKDAADADIIAASWSTASTKIIDHLTKIEQASEYYTGRPIRHVWTDSTVWNYVLNCTQVQAMGGSAATAYQLWDMVEDRGPDGNPVRSFTAVLKAYPHVSWHIYNGGLNVNGTYTRFFDGTKALFVPEPSDDWIQMGVGSEFVVEQVGASAKEAVGFYPWGNTTVEPAGIQLLAVDNFMPFLYVPKCVMWATCVF